MNAATGQWHLKRLIIRYSETGGSSLGIRFYLRHLLPLWKERNPQVAVVTEHSRLDHPNLRAEWASGEKYDYSMRNLKPRQIEDHMNLVRNSESPNLWLRHGGPRVWTERRSIQGLWQPSAEGMFRALKFAREKSWPPLIIAAFYIGKASGVPAARIVVVICACLWVACCGERLAAVPAVTAQTGSLWYTGTQYRCAPYLTGVATAALSEQGPLSGPPSGTAHKGAVAALQGVMTLLAWAVLLICMLYGGGGPLLGFESPLPKYPFGIRVAQLHFVIGRPLTGLAASYLMWNSLAGRAQRLQTALALPMWRPFARLSYSAYMMQVASFVLGLSLLSPFNSPDGAAAQAVSALSELSTDLLLYLWVVLYILFAFTLALPSYILVEYPGIACGRRIARALACPIAEGRGELVKPLV